MKARFAALVGLLAIGAVTTTPVALAGQTGSTSVAATSPTRPPVSPSTQAKSDDAVQADHEVPSLRTWNSRTYKSQRGLQAVIYPGPINYQDATGKWQAIDNTLVASSAAGYAYQNQANGFTAYLPADLTRGVLVIAPGRAFAFSVEGATGAGTASGNTDTFANALPATTVTYSINNASVEETLTLQNLSAPATYQYIVRTDADLTAQLAAANRVDFVDRTGLTAFSFAATEMWDSATTGKGRSSAITLAIGPKVSGGQLLTLTPDRSWLASPMRRWPITIDPTVTYGTIGSAIYKQFTGADQDCYIQSNPTSGSCSGRSDYVGHASTSTDRTLFQFNVQNAVPNHVTVLAADLGVYLSGSQSTTGVAVDASQITTAWTSGVTWTTSNGTTSWAPGGAIASSPAWTNTSVGPGVGWYYWYLTQLAQGWVDGSTSNVGFLLKASNETAVNQLTFRSSGYAQSSSWPFLKVIYQLGIGEKHWYKFAAQPLTDRLAVGAQVASGNMILHEHLLTMKGTGQDLKLDLYYNNLSPALWDFGRSWVLNTGYDIYLAPHPDGVNFYSTTGEGFHFIKNGSTFSAPPGLDAGLNVNGDGTYTLTFRSGEKYNFSSNGLTFLSAVDKNGNKFTFAYNANGALTSITDTQGRVTTFGYTTTPTGCTFATASGLINLMTDSGGRGYQFGYDNNCNLTSYTDPLGGVTKFGYDANLNLSQVTDPVGNVSTLTYDTASRITSATYPAPSGTGYQTTFTYNAGNTVVKDGGGDITTYYSDNRERVAQVTDPAGKSWFYSFTGDNSVSSVQDPTSAQSTAGYAASNDPNIVTSGTGASASSLYGDSSHPHLATSMTDPQGNTANYVYDSPGNLTKETDPLNHSTQYAYNANGTRSSTTDTNGNITTYQYDSVGNLTGVFPVGPDFTYDNISREATMTDGKNQKTTYSYDALDRHTQVLYADGTSVSFVYNAADDVISMTDSTGTTTFTYDPLNRVTKKTLPGGQSITYVWDGNGNLTSETDSGGTTTYSYNNLNELTTIKDPANATTTIGYDAAYRETSIAYPNGVTVTMGRDNSGAETSVVAKNSSGATLLSQSYSYVNPATGAHTLQRYSVTDQAGNVTTYTYDGLNRLTGSTTKNSSGTVTDSRSYSYDALGNRVSQTINGVLTNYTYNLANSTMTVGTVTYTYDKDGNLISRSDGFTASYNSANLTTSMTPPGGTAISMTYSGPDQSNRVTAGTSSFVYDLKGASQRTSAGATVYESRDRNGQLLSERSSGGTYYLIADAAGSTIGLTSSTGALLSSWTYDPWGNTLSHTGTTSTPFLYQGGYLDAATGVYKLQTRYYDPSIGQWLQPSLNVLAPTQSRYAFQLNDAASLPTGLPGSP